MELRREPVQERAVVRVEEILEAARQVVARVGADRLTMNLVAERAGAGLGTVYLYFRDRAAVLDAIQPGRAVAFDVLTEIITRIDEALIDEALYGHEDTVSDWPNSSVLDLLKHLRQPWTEARS
jgi:AcrR family transcriptional regulator